MTGMRLTQLPGGDVDLEVGGSGMVIGDTLSQEEYLVLVTHKGEWKEWPLIGVGIDDMAGDEDTRYWKREIVENMSRVGIKIKGVALKNGVLELKQ